jgi:hypothetical protein
VAAIYSVDTSSLMDWQARYYPVDVFAELVQRMNALADAGQLMAPALVREELQKVGTAGLKAWAETHKRMFVPNGDLLVEA